MSAELKMILREAMIWGRQQNNQYFSYEFSKAADAKIEKLLSILKPAEEVQPVGEVFDEFVGLGIRTAVARWYVAGPKAGTQLYTRPPAAEADRMDERETLAVPTQLVAALLEAIYLHQAGCASDMYPLAWVLKQTWVEANFRRAASKEKKE